MGSVASRMVMTAPLAWLADRLLCAVAVPALVAAILLRACSAARDQAVDVGAQARRAACEGAVLLDGRRVLLPQRTDADERRAALRRYADCVRAEGARR